MFNRLIQLFVVIILVILPVFSASAQSDDRPELTETFSFSNGVSFSYPANWAMDDMVTSTDFMIMLTEQNTLGAFVQVYELTTLFGDMELDLAFVQDMYGSSSADAWNFEYDIEDYETVKIDGRELSVLAFEGEQNSSPIVGYVVVVPYSDGGFGLLIAFTVSEPPATYEQDVIAIAASMDVTTGGGIAGPSLGLSGNIGSIAPDDETDTIDIAAIELTETFVFSNGVSFGYPANWAMDDIVSSTDFMIMLTEQNTLGAFVQVYELTTLFGDMELDLAFVQDMYGSSSADAWNFEYDIEDYETVKIGGSELSVLAFEGEQNSSPIVGYVVVVPYSDGGFGLLIAFTVSEPPATYEQDVIAIAASMDVADE